mmetsp:Transcript_57702/g.165505  ORF Transcript_57702/g.165505 Transcript_57702/m.165505 type:complete len:387 (-) Transcript_57702:354-1514(-)
MVCRLLEQALQEGVFPLPLVSVAPRRTDWPCTPALLLAPIFVILRLPLLISMRPFASCAPRRLLFRGRLGFGSGGPSDRLRRAFSWLSFHERCLRCIFCWLSFHEECLFGTTQLSFRLLWVRDFLRRHRDSHRRHLQHSLEEVSLLLQLESFFFQTLDPGLLDRHSSLVFRFEAAQVYIPVFGHPPDTGTADVSSDSEVLTCKGTQLLDVGLRLIGRSFRAQRHPGRPPVRIFRGPGRPGSSLSGNLSFHLLSRRTLCEVWMLLQESVPGNHSFLQRFEVADVLRPNSDLILLAFWVLVHVLDFVAHRPVRETFLLHLPSPHGRPSRRRCASRPGRSGVLEARAPAHRHLRRRLLLHHSFSTVSSSSLPFDRSTQGFRAVTRPTSW